MNEKPNGEDLRDDLVRGDEEGGHADELVAYVRWHVRIWIGMGERGEMGIGDVVGDR